MDNVCVYAFPQKVKPIAIVVPEENALRAIVGKLKIANKHANLAELTRNKDVKDVVKKDMLAAGKLAGLQGIELVSDIILSSEPWTPENVYLLETNLISGPCYGGNEIVPTQY